MRRRRRHAGRHGGPVRRHRPRLGHHVDDDQLAGRRSSWPCTWPPPRPPGSSAPALGGTLQNDILKEYQAQKEFVFPPRPSMRLVARHDRASAPPRCPGGTRSRSPATTSARPAPRPRRSWPSPSANGFAYVELAPPGRPRRRRLRARACSFFFNAHIDFFEEIAKYRAARRIWARWMRERYGATDERSLRMRFHTQTAGRVAHRAAARAQHRPHRHRGARRRARRHPEPAHQLDGRGAAPCPTEKAARLALRTQQVIAHETGVANVADPLGGSWFVEELTDELERQAEEIFAHLDELGDGSILEGVHAALDDGWFQGEIADAAYELERKVNDGRRIVVGVNRFTEGNEDDADRDPADHRRAGAAPDQAAAGGQGRPRRRRRGRRRSLASAPRPPTPRSTSCRR